MQITNTKVEISTVTIEVYIQAIMACAHHQGGYDLKLDFEASPLETIATLRSRAPCSVAEQMVNTHIKKAIPLSTT